MALQTNDTMTGCLDRSSQIEKRASVVGEVNDRILCSVHNLEGMESRARCLADSLFGCEPQNDMAENGPEPVLTGFQMTSNYLDLLNRRLDELSMQITRLEAL